MLRNRNRSMPSLSMPNSRTSNSRRNTISSRPSRTSSSPSITSSRLSAAAVQHNQQQAQRNQQQSQYNQQQAQHNQQQQRIQQSAWQQHRSQNWQSDHRNWQQRGGYRGYRIPDDRYRGYFGPSHGFRINTLPFLVVGGYPRFQYEGYWISAVDPWPSNWGDDWYDNDDVYVSYEDNGYYMYNRSYPGQGIAINITF